MMTISIILFACGSLLAAAQLIADVLHSALPGAWNSPFVAAAMIIGGAVVAYLSEFQGTKNTEE